MDNKLYLEEWKIDSIRDEEDGLGIKFKKLSLKGNAVLANVSLYEKDLIAMQTILGCNEEQLKGQQITVAIKEFLVKAIGYQGLYLPLYYGDDTSKIMSEGELCDLLGSYDVVRIDKNGEQIASYEVESKCLKKKQTCNY